jgi:hypothetical protein
MALEKELNFLAFDCFADFVLVRGESWAGGSDRPLGGLQHGSHGHGTTTLRIWLRNDDLKRNNVSTDSFMRIKNNTCR